MFWSIKAQAHSVTEINRTFAEIHKELISKHDLRAALNGLLEYSVEKGKAPSGVGSLSNLQLRRNLRWLLQGVRDYMRSVEKISRSKNPDHEKAYLPRYSVFKPFIVTLLSKGNEAAYKMLDLTKYTEQLKDKAKNSKSLAVVNV